MTSANTTGKSTHTFDYQNITWHPLGDFKHFLFSMLNVDVDKKLVDAILKFEPNEKIFLHRHMAQTNTFVIQGEHRIYEPDGSVKEVRDAGSYTASSASIEPHSEGGGAHGAIVLYSIRAESDLVFEILDSEDNVVGTLGLNDFNEVYQAQNP